MFRHDQPLQKKRTASKENEFDDLMIFELSALQAKDDSEFEKDHRGQLVRYLKKCRAEFFPASSCKRHVYILRKSDLEESLKSARDKDKKFLEVELKEKKYDNLNIYFGNDALIFLIKWISGSLNESKFFQDTYNKKTVEIGFNCFKSLYPGKASLEAKELKPDTREESSDREGWIKLEAEESKRIKSFFRDKLLHEDRGLVPYLEKIFTLTKLLSSVLQSLKESPEFKGLWAGNITKLTLSKAAKEDSEFFTEVLECRKKFVDLSANSIFNASFKFESKEDIKSEASVKLSGLTAQIAFLSGIAQKKNEDYKAKKEVGAPATFPKIADPEPATLVQKEEVLFKKT